MIKPKLLRISLTWQADAFTLDIGDEATCELASFLLVWTLSCCLSPIQKGIASRVSLEPCEGPQAG